MTTLCTADLNYVSSGEPMPVARTVQIFDARQATLPGWEACGFELVDHVSTVQNWADDDEIAAVHHAETESLARSMTGCDHALVSGHIKRGPDEARRHQDLAPITFVHSDFAPSYLDLVRDSYRQADNEGGRAALDRNGITPDDVWAASRVVILQFWRNLGEPRMDHHRVRSSGLPGARDRRRSHRGRDRGLPRRVQRDHGKRPLPRRHRTCLGCRTLAASVLRQEAVSDGPTRPNAH